MTMRLTTIVLSFAVLAGTAAVASAQGNPTGTISGHVSDPDGLAVPGATVTVASAVLQGVRTGTTSANGDYIIPFLPAGDYEVTVELQGFKTVKRTIGVKMAETQPLNITLTLAAVAETVTVTGQSPDVVLSATVASNFNDEIAADYALSEERLLPRHEAWFAAAASEEELERLRRIAQTPAASMVGVFAELDRRYGGVEAYLRDVGVSEDELELARARLRG